MLAEPETSQRKELKHILFPEIKGDFEFAQDVVVVDGFFSWRNLIVFFAPVENDQSVEKVGEIPVLQLGIFRFVFFFQPERDFLGKKRLAAQTKNLSHFVVVEMERVAEGAQDVVVAHVDKDICPRLH